MSASLCSYLQWVSLHFTQKLQSLQRTLLFAPDVLKQDCSEHLTAALHQKKAWHLEGQCKNCCWLQRTPDKWSEVETSSQVPGGWQHRGMILWLRLGGDRHGISHLCSDLGVVQAAGGKAEGPEGFVPMCDRELQLLVEWDNLEHVPKHLWQQNPPNSFYSLQLEPSWLLCPPRATLPPSLGSLNWPLHPTPLQYSWNRFPRWRQRKKTSRGKTLWSYHQNCPQQMELAIFCPDGELYLKALHPLFMMGIFLQGIIRRKLVSSAEKLGKHQGRPVSLFHTAGFSAAQVFFPLALGPSKDECWISLSITHRLICY